VVFYKKLEKKEIFYTEKFIQMASNIDAINFYTSKRGYKTIFLVK